MKQNNKREMIVEMISEVEGGREVVAAHLGYNKACFENRLYEKKGQQFTFDDLIRIQELSHTNYLAQFCAPVNHVVIEEPDAEMCDTVELSNIMMLRDGAHGDFTTAIRDSLADGKLTSAELKDIITKKTSYFALLEREIASLKLLYCDETSKKLA